VAEGDVVAALERVDPALGMFIDLQPDRVLRAARDPRGGRLSGVLVAVKDLVDTAGVRTTYGSAHHADHVPRRNAAVVDLLESAGAILLGKTNLNEYAYGVSGFNPHYGPILSPRDLRRTAGGSSGGSAAAVASGACRLAVGTDTSGSVRIPAACCGVYGLKLAHGAVSMQGIHPLAESYDSVGFLAAGVEDLELLLGFGGLPDVADLRIRHLGDDLEAPRLPDEHWSVFRAEVWKVHERRYRSEPERYGDDVRWKLGLEIGDVRAARRVLEGWRTRFLAALEDVDVLVGPLLDGRAPLLEAARYEYGHDEFVLGERLLRHTAAYNELGWPALAVPTADGPLQVAARPGDVPAILAVGAALGLPSEDVLAR
jgi:aspartyl-tRNA(Asn)/glutamyl-tRNA(Gln) amidotransferase subunit A